MAPGRGGFGVAKMKQLGFHEINEPIEDYVEDPDVERVRRRLVRSRPVEVEVVP